MSVTKGVGYCCQIQGNMVGAIYCNFLELFLIKLFDYLGLDKNSIIFQHDNVSNCTAQKVIDCLYDLGMTTLRWLTQSPNINPIEHLLD